MTGATSADYCAVDCVLVGRGTSLARSEPDPGQDPVLSFRILDRCVSSSYHMGLLSVANKYFKLYVFFSKQVRSVSISVEMVLCRHKMGANHIVQY